MSAEDADLVMGPHTARVFHELAQSGISAYDATKKLGHTIAFSIDMDRAMRELPACDDAELAMLATEHDTAFGMVAVRLLAERREAGVL